jgi:hypothetical protein
MAKFSRDGDDREQPRRDRSGPTLPVALAIAAILVLVCGVGGVATLWLTGRAVVAERDRVEAVRAEAEADARRAAEVQAEMNEGRPAPLDREAFEKAVLGRTPDEVTAAVGKPDGTSEGGRETYWRYEGRTWDPTAGKVDEAARVVFEGGKVARVEFD